MERVPDLDVEVLGWALFYTATSLFLGHLTSTGLFPVACSTLGCHLVENLGPYLYHQAIMLGRFGLGLFLVAGFGFLILWLQRPKPTLQPHEALLAESVARARARYAPLRRRLHAQVAATDPSTIHMSSPHRVMAQHWPNGNQFPPPLGVVELGMAAHAEMYAPSPPPPYQAPAAESATVTPEAKAPVAAAAKPEDQVAQWAKEAKEAEEKNYQQEALRICQVYFDLKKQAMLQKPAHYIPVNKPFDSVRVAPLVDALVKPQTMYARVAGNSVVIQEGIEPISAGTPSQGWSPYD